MTAPPTLAADVHAAQIERALDNAGFNVWGVEAPDGGSRMSDQLADQIQAALEKAGIADEFGVEVSETGNVQTGVRSHQVVWAMVGNSVVNVNVETGKTVIEGIVTDDTLKTVALIRSVQAGGIAAQIAALGIPYELGPMLAECERRGWEAYARCRTPDKGFEPYALIEVDEDTAIALNWSFEPFHGRTPTEALANALLAATAAHAADEERDVE